MLFHSFKLYFAFPNGCLYTLLKNIDAMEPEVVAFLKRVALCIFLTFCWLAINVTIGLRFNLAFVENHVSAGNIIFYIWMTASFVLMVLYFIRIWKHTAKW